MPMVESFTVLAPVFKCPKSLSLIIVNHGIAVLFGSFHSCGILTLNMPSVLHEISISTT